MRVLVTGAGGLVGGRLAPLLARRATVVAGVHVARTVPGLTAIDVDLLDAASVESAVESARPDAILHCAALGDPDRCEREPELALSLNVRAAETLARLCHRRGVRLLALSTDLVFGGDRPGVTEEDQPQPLMTYGRTKLAGEEAVLSAAPDAVVLRVALVHGRGHGPRGTASEAIAWSLRAGRPLRLFIDQYRTPIDPESVADAIERLLERPLSGRFHLGGPERLSRYDLGLRVARCLGLPPDGITAVTQRDLATAAPRPADVSLDSGHARRELGWTPRPLDAAILEGRRSPDIIPPR